MGLFPTVGHAVLIGIRGRGGRARREVGPRASRADAAAPGAVPDALDDASIDGVARRPAGSDGGQHLVQKAGDGIHAERWRWERHSRVILRLADEMRAAIVIELVVVPCIDAVPAPIVGGAGGGFRSPVAG